MTDTTAISAPRKRARRMAREARLPNNVHAAEQTASPKEPESQSEKAKTKATLVLELLQHPDGATLEELVAATNWLPHTTRAALTGIKKKGHALSSEKVDGVRKYRIAGTLA